QTDDVVDGAVVAQHRPQDAALGLLILRRQELIGDAAHDAPPPCLPLASSLRTGLRFIHSLGSHAFASVWVCSETALRGGSSSHRRSFSQVAGCGIVERPSRVTCGSRQPATFCRSMAARMASSSSLDGDSLANACRARGFAALFG